MKRLLQYLGPCCLVFAGHAGISLAEDRAVTVLGSGEVLAKPDALEMTVRASAAAELTGDAVVKYQASLRRLRSAILKLAMKNLSIEERALQIGSTSPDTDEEMVFAAQPQPAAVKSTVQIARALRISVRGIDKMSEAEVIDAIGKLMDTAKDAGAALGSGAPVGNAYQSLPMYGANPAAAIQFVVRHPEPLREQAYRKAFEDATTKATRLAKLAGKRLGDAISIEEDTAMRWVAYGNRAEPAETSRLASDELKDIPVLVMLRVRFSLLDNHAEKNEATPNVVP